MKKLIVMLRCFKKLLFEFSLEDKILFTEAFFLTGIMRFKILYVPFNKLKTKLGTYNEESAKEISKEEYKMACFLVPAAEAVVVTAAKKTAGSKPAEKTHKISFVRKLKWLTNMLWGGSVLLCFEHIWHGEIVPWFPFLTAAENPADTAEMLHEMSTIGVTMAVIITAVWCGMLGVVKVMENNQQILQTISE